MKNYLKKFICQGLSLLLLMLSGCTMLTEIYDEAIPLAGADVEEVEEGIANEVIAISKDTPFRLDATAVASGEKTKYNSEAIIDYSNASDGYIMVKYLKETSKRLKAQVKGPKRTYTFNLEAGEWASLPLADEDGSYKISIFKNAGGTKYATVLSHKLTVKLADPFAPFLHSNQYVDYDNAPEAVAFAYELCEGLDTLEAVDKVYHWVVKNIKYDYELAKSVKSGYLPVLDEVLESGKGICFDYAALMTGMLRSREIPCKLVVGYAGDVYHAWISVWTEDKGWIDGIVYFDGKNWQRMDPTFASSAKGDKDILDFIGDGENYSVKYIY